MIISKLIVLQIINNEYSLYSKERKAFEGEVFLVIALVLNQTFRTPLKSFPFIDDENLFHEHTFLFLNERKERLLLDQEMDKG